MVICLNNPGVANWLDTDGHKEGTIVGRAYLSQATPVTPIVKRIKVEDMAEQLPADTKHVTREQRQSSASCASRGTAQDVRGHREIDAAIDPQRSMYRSLKVSNRSASCCLRARSRHTLHSGWQCCVELAQLHPMAFYPGLLREWGRQSLPPMHDKQLMEAHRIEPVVDSRVLDRNDVGGGAIFITDTLRVVHVARVLPIVESAKKVVFQHYVSKGRVTRNRT